MLQNRDLSTGAPCTVERVLVARLTIVYVSSFVATWVVTDRVKRTYIRFNNTITTLLCRTLVPSAVLSGWKYLFFFNI